jgi:glucokinase
MSKTNKQYTIGIDIGGTKMSAVLFDGSKVLADYTLATPHDSVNHVVVMIEALIAPLFDKAKGLKKGVEGIGISVAGIVDFKEQIISKNSPNLKILDKVKLAELVEEKRGIPAKMDNDANCFVRAESLLGAGQKYNNVYGITIGTGIGGGWWLNNEMYYGSHGGANEPGRFIMDTKEKIDIELMYQKLTQHNLYKLAQEAYRADALAEKVFDEMGEILGVFCANVVNLIDPEIFIIGGGAIEVCDLFIPKAKKTMREYVMNPESKKIKIEKSKLGELAGAIGAALLVK